jgi:hypothetical protein
MCARSTHSPKKAFANLCLGQRGFALENPKSNCKPSKRIWENHPKPSCLCQPLSLLLVRFPNKYLLVGRERAIGSMDLNRVTEFYQPKGLEAVPKWQEGFAWRLLSVSARTPKRRSWPAAKSASKTRQRRKKRPGWVEMIKIANLRLQDIIETPIAVVVTA